MSDEHPDDGRDELLTIGQIIQRFGVSRQTLHRWRARGRFPAPEPSPGSTRMAWRESKVAAFIAANPKRPGARTDLQRQAEEEAHSDDSTAGDDQQQ
ncbi:helix-turn-helix transcriptional regulator [Streptomyces sp. NPDC057611]|uniref:helix-turn-helix transcriptional regulator n=1 Tax=unclassified Streptomyces TaxID=2593676 RepID=UPI0035DDF4BB